MLRPAGKNEPTIGGIVAHARSVRGLRVPLVVTGNPGPWPNGTRPEKNRNTMTILVSFECTCHAFARWPT